MVSANTTAGTAVASTSPAPPRPLPVPPALDIPAPPEQKPELELGHASDIWPRRNICRRYTARSTTRASSSSTHGPELRAGSASPRPSHHRACSETRFIRSESPIIQFHAQDYRLLVDKTASVGWDLDDTSSDKVRGRERIQGRPRLRVQLPLPSNVNGGLHQLLQSNKDSSYSRNSVAVTEFVIYADDVNVIPSPVDDDGTDASGIGGESYTNILINSTAPQVDINLSGFKGDIDWPYCDTNVDHNVENSQMTKPLPPLVVPLSVGSAPQTCFDSQATLEKSRHLPIKRKPAPPVRMQSLPIALDLGQSTEITGDSACSPDSASICEFSSETKMSPIVNSLTPNPTSIGEDNERVYPQHCHNSQILALSKHDERPFPSPCSSPCPPRPHSSPPDTLNQRSSSLIKHTLRNALPKSVTANWQALSSLDLTCSDELAIYLESLFIIAGGGGDNYRSQQYSRSKSNRRLSTSSYYSDSVVSLSVSSTVSGSDSGLPSPSEYAPYLNPIWAQFSGPPAALVPGAVGYHNESSPISAACFCHTAHGESHFNPSPRQDRGGAVVKMGQLFLPGSSSKNGIAGVHTLDVLLLAPCRTPNSERDMPCRTTILKATRRVAFIRRGLAPIDSGNNNHGSSPTKEENPYIPHSTTPGQSSYLTVPTIGSGRGLLNREKSLRARQRGGTILQHRGRDVYLELVILGTVMVGSGSQEGGEQKAGYDAFLNRLDGSVWFVAQPTPTTTTTTSTTGSSTIATSSTIFDDWLSNFLSLKPSATERVLAVRWADGLDCVDALRGLNAGGNCGSDELQGDDAPAMVEKKLQRRRTWGIGLQCPPNAVELEGVEVYLGKGVEEEEEGWFVPESW